MLPQKVYRRNSYATRFSEGIEGVNIGFSVCTYLVKYALLNETSSGKIICRKIFYDSRSYRNFHIGNREVIEPLKNYKACSVLSRVQSSRRVARVRTCTRAFVGDIRTSGQEEEEVSAATRLDTQPSKRGSGTVTSRDAAAESGVPVIGTCGR